MSKLEDLIKEVKNRKAHIERLTDYRGRTVVSINASSLMSVEVNGEFRTNLNSAITCEIDRLCKKLEPLENKLIALESLV